MSRSKRIWLALGTTTLLIAVTVIVTGRVPGCGPNYWLAAYLGGHLTSVPDGLVGAEMRRIAALNEVGLCMLLDALGSSRPSVADAAAATLHEQFDEWKKLPRERSSKPVARVASELARRVDAWPQPARLRRGRSGASHPGLADRQSAGATCHADRRLRIRHEDPTGQ